MKTFLTTLTLFMLSVTVFAKWVDGYITLNDGSRLNGRINVPYVNMESRAILVKGMDLSHFYYSVRFATKETGKQFYYPEDIKGFGFNNNGAMFHFVSENVHYKSIVRAERERSQFLQVLYKGDLILLSRLVPFYHEIHGMEGWCGVNHINSYDYYLSNAEKGLTRLEVNKSNGSIKDILALYGVHDTFLQSQPDNINRFDVFSLLIEYEQWKKNTDESVILEI
ncbi:hypothetical protein [Carboxylicivirga sp. RSCT41]|uniref:hypothetical protein n=1 Tax=Carboxylicivirga agarovorans TaxID=3417570 RepID=UPI003D32B23F